MRIIDLLDQNKKFFSLEFFPPKNTAAWPDFFEEVAKLTAIKPLFASVTYGAGGSTRNHTLQIVHQLRHMGLEPMAHLTCVGSDEEGLEEFLRELEAEGVDNVLALRGDLPDSVDYPEQICPSFCQAGELVSFIRTRHPSMGIGVAGYPEKHPEAACLEEDAQYLVEKVKRGADFVITQLFFNNDHYFNFVDKIRAMGLKSKIIPGILPVPAYGSLKRILRLGGNLEIPADYINSLEKADKESGSQAVAKLGLAYAKKQIIDLMRRGAPGIHLYSLNRSEACLEIASDPEIVRLMSEPDQD